MHHHLDDQLRFLQSRDAELQALIGSIKTEEEQHLDHAEASLTNRGAVVEVLRLAIAVITNVLIWMSTSGDSARMVRDLQADRV